MDKAYNCRVVAWWTAGRTGLAKCESAPNTIHFTAPPQFGGLDGRWTPEELLLAALASCFTTTFKVVAESSNFEYTDLEVATEGLVSKTESGYGFSEIVLRPTLTIPGEEKKERALDLLQKARNLCLVLRTFKIAEKFEPQVVVSQLSRPALATSMPVHRL